MASRAIVWKAQVEGCESEARVGERDPVDLLVGHRVRAVRLRRRLSRRELAAAIGLRVEDIRGFEAGSTRIGAARLLCIADVLDIDVGALFEIDDSNDGRLRPVVARSIH